MTTTKNMLADIKCQIASSMEPLQVEDKITLLKDLLQDFDTPQHRRDCKSKARKDRYMLDDAYRRASVETQSLQ